VKLLREPLVHFLILGAAIFAAFSFMTRHKTDKPREIVISQGTLENIVTGFSRTWQRPPTEDELRGLVRDYIREEAAYREALAMGLDRDDTIVRRRLRQKLEFLSDDLASRSVPTDADLVFDVRFLPNPHFVPRLRRFTGKDPKVRRYIRSFPQTAEFLKRIEGLLIYLIPHYIQEGKSYLTIAIGCTGGKHRSVMLGEAIKKALEKHSYSAKVVHRDIDK